jgi:hypothetical protein
VNAAELALVKADVRVGPGNSAESIRADLAASLDRHEFVWEQKRIDHLVAVWTAASSTGPAPLVAARVLREHFRPLVEIGRQLRDSGKNPPPED